MIKIVKIKDKKLLLHFFCIGFLFPLLILIYYCFFFQTYEYLFEKDLYFKLYNLCITLSETEEVIIQLTKIIGLLMFFFHYACMKGFIDYAFYKGANKLILVFYLTLVPNHYNFATKILKKKLTGICIVSFI